MHLQSNLIFDLIENHYLLKDFKEDYIKLINSKITRNKFNSFCLLHSELLKESLDYFQKENSTNTLTDKHKYVLIDPMNYFVDRSVSKSGKCVIDSCITCTHENYFHLSQQYHLSKTNNNTLYIHYSCFLSKQLEGKKQQIVLEVNYPTEISALNISFVDHDRYKITLFKTASGEFDFRFGDSTFHIFSELDKISPDYKKDLILYGGLNQEQQDLINLTIDNAEYAPFTSNQKQNVFDIITKENKINAVKKPSP